MIEKFELPVLYMYFMHAFFKFVARIGEKSVCTYFPVTDMHARSQEHETFDVILRNIKSG